MLGAGRYLTSGLGESREFLPHEELVSHLLHPPAGQGVQARRGQHFAATQAEAGMVQGAAHGFTHYESLVQRSVVVSAFGAHGGIGIPQVHQQYAVFAHMTEQRSALVHVARGDALG